ncbi:MAG: orotidine-5'-phosphate decarboxylase [Gammaproteobacteria bacterium]|nr:MAG: orotidine-5'-phosphate decarboxylase [Gammaproteobacteria bacterium]RLA54286.1 MAG: orotidine-5'-phosphate decarboxylase [Gammaproteobacteria bacterium]
MTVLSETKPPSLLSSKDIPSQERLIFALDVPSIKEAKRLVNDLGDAISFYKIGLELFMSGNYLDFVGWLKKKDKKVFVDLKFFDVPQTVGSAIKQLRQYGASFATIHGNDEIMKAAAEQKGDMKVLAVTMLTSLDDGDVKDLGFKVNIKEIVLSRAKRALEIGCDGVISSGLEAPELRDKLGAKFIIVTPGIRPLKNTDDQKRTVDVEQAFLNGADYIVVGRPIKDHCGFNTPKEAAISIQERIGKLFDAP